MKVRDVVVVRGAAVIVAREQGVEGIWGCNATGVYSGLVADGNGNSADVSNRNRTFLRALPPAMVLFGSLSA
jgi:hypothetical protein